MHKARIKRKTRGFETGCHSVCCNSLTADTYLPTSSFFCRFGLDGRGWLRAGQKGWILFPCFESWEDRGLAPDTRLGLKEKT